MYFLHTRSHDRLKHAVWVYHPLISLFILWNMMIILPGTHRCMCLFRVSVFSVSLEIIQTPLNAMWYHKVVHIDTTGVLGCLCSHVEYSNLFKSLGKIDVTFFKWCLCVIRSPLNQMLFVTSMNVSSDTAITEWLRVLDLFQGKEGESSGWKNSRLPPFHHFSFSILPFFSFKASLFLSV